jgi:hypothetical protein
MRAHEQGSSSWNHHLFSLSLSDLSSAIISSENHSWIHLHISGLLCFCVFSPSNSCNHTFMFYELSFFLKNNDKFHDVWDHVGLYCPFCLYWEHVIESNICWMNKWVSRWRGREMEREREWGGWEGRGFLGVVDLSSRRYLELTTNGWGSQMWSQANMTPLNSS